MTGVKNLFILFIPPRFSLHLTRNNRVLLGSKLKNWLCFPTVLDGGASCGVDLLQSLERPHLYETLSFA